ncbi:HTTM domain-containing protein [Aquimarina sp. U1-2]|uniref:HTTM domain-containing protein n=1 Tax=Aquimarina sp. U1-2 TaxID=2823141 RepID=UPI001AEC7F49|nr:HTTM domain-containing protein [Aquimarina sp. U1-2]MBP2832293.1 HTTM domain-containing protein [Aquimarina sp. U1-2]
MEIKQAITTYLNRTSRAATLAAFRILFGVLMLISLIRFLMKGWVYKFYIEPKFHFKYYGFSWVETWGEYTYILFFIAILACIGIILGYKYRLAIILFFLSFTYIELIDKTTYLNHYYFISILSFLLCFLPLNATFSLDAYYKNRTYNYVPRWTVDAIKVLIGVVYFYAGLAKLNSDWLLRAQPLKIWLSSKIDFPVIGKFMNDAWFHYVMSWGGAVYDLTIPFLLVFRKTRPFAFILVVIFHVCTRVLFPIGVFPYVMICVTLVFFSGEWHEKFLSKIKNILKLTSRINTTRDVYLPKFPRKIFLVVCIFLGIQLVMPFRYLLYPGELFWTEEGYRFSWRVMLIEKAGYTTFRILKYDTGHSFTVDNTHFLNAFQSKQMSTQPDFIVEYAHFLGDHYKKELKNENIGVFVEGYISLNGRISKAYIDPRIDLLKVKDGFEHKTWILPFEDEIKGL